MVINMKIRCEKICLSVSLMIELTLILTVIVPISKGDDWSQSCSSNCTCKWTNGKKSAICNSLQLTSIPKILSSELQVLVLSYNDIPYLNREEFFNLGLLNLQRIYLKKSEIQFVHRATFKDLKILIEIDLSDNKIEMLDKGTFMGNDRLRILYLNGNPLKRLVAYQFPILPHLRTLDLHDCLISYIDPAALSNLNMLEFLYLKNNLLESLNEYVFQHMTNLKTLILDDNPWQCNCNLRKFRTWYINSKLNSITLVCKGPAKHKETMWEQVNEEQFGCAPRIEIFNNEDVQNIEIGTNTTFNCLVYGDPLPDVIWELNGKIIDADNVIFEIENIASDRVWNNLTVINMTSLDAGTYVCTASNDIGITSQNVSVYLTEIVQHVLVKTPETFWYFGLIMGTFGTVFLLILISFVVCLCKRAASQRSHSKRRGVKPSISFNDQEKKLLDLSITTTTNDRMDSCLDNNHSTITAMSKAESVSGVEPIEIHSVGNNRSSVHAHHGMLIGSLHKISNHQQMQSQHSQNSTTNVSNSVVCVRQQNHQQQLMAVVDSSCNVGNPTTTSNAIHTNVNQISEEFPLNVSVFPPPQEFCSNIVSNPAFGKIFISVSVTQDMLDSTDIKMYPDLLNIPKRIQDSNDENGVSVMATSASITNDIVSLPITERNTSSTRDVSVTSYATLPRNTQRRGILKKESSFQQHHQLPQANLYTHDEIVSYHNLDAMYNEKISSPPPQPSLAHCHHNALTSNAISNPCSGCISAALIQTQSSSAVCTSPSTETTLLRTTDKTKSATSASTVTTNGTLTSKAYLKYDNMGRRITASGNSTLSLPDDERVESETLFNERKMLISTTPITTNITKKMNGITQNDYQKSLTATAVSGGGCGIAQPSISIVNSINKSALKTIDKTNEFVSL